MRLFNIKFVIVCLNNFLPEFNFIEANRKNAALLKRQVAVEIMFRCLALV